jgi:hypothetical protein
MVKGRNILKTTSILLLAAALSGCASNAKQITFSDGTTGHIATCGGPTTTWIACYDTAYSTCASGYEVVEREGFEHDGLIKRNLYFKCRQLFSTPK